MKKLILLLLIPIMSYSQISYNDIMSINSKKQFIRVSVENGYEYDSTIDGRLLYNLGNDGESLSMGLYFEGTEEFMFMFPTISVSGGIVDVDGDGVSDSSYDLIFSEVKRKCRYFDVLTVTNTKGEDVDWVSYMCDVNNDIRKMGIGFMKKNGLGYVRKFDFMTKE